MMYWSSEKGGFLYLIRVRPFYNTPSVTCLGPGNGVVGLNYSYPLSNIISTIIHTFRSKTDGTEKGAVQRVIVVITDLKRGLDI